MIIQSIENSIFKFFMNLYEKYSVYITLDLVYLLYVVFQKAFAIALDVWDDDGGNFLGIGKADDLVDVTSSNVGNVPAQKDLQSAVVKSVTVQL